MRRRLRGLAGVTWPWTGASPNINLNSEGVNPTKASLSSIAISSTGFVDCLNCHAEIAPSTYSITFQYCLAAVQSSKTVFWATSSSSDGCLGYSAAATLYPWQKCTTPNLISTQNFLDCAPSVSWISGSTTNQPSLISSNSLNAALNVEAFLSGDMSSNLILASNGISGSGSTGGCANSITSSSCTPQTLIPLSSALVISITTGLTAVIKVGMTGAAVYSGALTGSIEAGVQASAKAFKVGGKSECCPPVFQTVTYPVFFSPLLHTHPPAGPNVQFIPRIFKKMHLTVAAI